MTDQTPKRAAIYARLSTAQTGVEESDSIAGQLADLRKLAAREGFDVVAEFVDDGISGYSKKARPDFQRLMATMAAGEVDVILARHSDRLERNEHEGFQVRVASVKHKVRWVFASGMQVDPATAEGGLLAKILSAISEFESAVKSARLVQHYDGKRQSGTFGAPAGSFGYRGFEQEPYEAALIKQAYADIAAGKSVGSIVTAWNKAKVPQRRGGARWTYAHINTLLRRPRNAGLVADQDGQIIETIQPRLVEGQRPVEGIKYSTWEPIVTVGVWQQVQHILSDPARTTSPGAKPRHLSGGIAKCGVCGQPMQSNTVSDRRAGTRYTILRCKNLDKGGVRHPSARVADLEPLIRDAVIAAFTFGPSELFRGEDGPDIAGLQAEASRLRDARQDVLDLLRMTAITKAEAAHQLAQLESPLRTIQDALEAAVASNASAHMLVDLRHGLRGADGRASLDGYSDLKAELTRRWAALDVDQRKRLVRQLLDVRVHGGRGVGKYEITHKVVTSLNDEPVAA